MLKRSRSLHIIRRLCSNSSDITLKTKALADAILSPEDDEASKFSKRIALSKAITLVESQSRHHMEQADSILNYLYNSSAGQNEDFFRIGITGPPGSGKSSLIEKFGNYILNDAKGLDFNPKKLAVVCIDPSSLITGGSILGDKTRMKDLSTNPRAFVRPSPSKGILGGVASYTNDVTSLCQAAGFNLIIVETVGVGQSECSITKATDMVILVVAPGNGDAVQGMKKGILEISDMLVVNKADGSLLPTAQITAAEYKSATQFFRSKMKGWETPPVLLASAETGRGIEEIWKRVVDYRKLVIENGELQKNRAEQKHYWMMKHLEDLITFKINTDVSMMAAAEKLKQDLDLGLISTRAAAEKLFVLISEK